MAESLGAGSDLELTHRVRVDAWGQVWAARSPDGDALDAWIVEADAPTLDRARAQLLVLTSALDPAVASWWAVEIVEPAGTTDEGFVASIGRVVFLAGAVEHPTLAQEIADGLHLDVGSMLRLGADLARGLAAIHAAGLAHGRVTAPAVRRTRERELGRPAVRLHMLAVAWLADGARATPERDVDQLLELLAALPSTDREAADAHLGRIAAAAPMSARVLANRLFAEALREVVQQRPQPASRQPADSEVASPPPPPALTSPALTSPAPPTPATSAPVVPPPVVPPSPAPGAPRPPRPDRASARAGRRRLFLVLGLVLVVAASIAAAVHAPVGLTAPLSVLAGAVVVQRAARLRRQGPLDAIVAGLTGLVVALIGLGFVLDVMPGGITTASWAGGAGALGLVVLGLSARLDRATAPLPAASRPRLPRPRAGWLWYAVAGAAVLVSILVARSATDTATAQPLALSEVTAGSTSQVLVQAGPSGGSYELVIGSATSRTIWHGPFTLAAHATIRFPVDALVSDSPLLTLRATGTTTSLRSLEKGFS